MSEKPNPIDEHVGRRLRLRHTLLGMSQERLGQLLGLTFQPDLFKVGVAGAPDNEPAID